MQDSLLDDQSSNAIKPETPALIQINDATSLPLRCRSDTPIPSSYTWRPLIRAVRLPRQTQASRSGDAGQFASDVPKKTDGLPPSEFSYPFKVTRFGFSDDNLVRVEPLSPKEYPERGTHEGKNANKRKPQQ
jgi:hypothetical protein